MTIYRKILGKIKILSTHNFFLSEWKTATCCFSLLFKIHDDGDFDRSVFVLIRLLQILIRTIKRSAPDVLRFLLCAFVFYFGFAICGWVVLGPYHIKVCSTRWFCSFLYFLRTKAAIAFSAS